jgi:pimeloyl-ACP methyl ester carboxylesterase
MLDSSAAVSPKARTIVIVHGLWMTGAVFALQRAQLVRRGYRVRTFNYSSLRTSLDEIASQLARFIGALETPGVHLVGHSLGGLVVMHALALFPQLPIGRVVLVGCPLAGSRPGIARVAAGACSTSGCRLRGWHDRGDAALRRGQPAGAVADTERRRRVSR